MSQIATIYANLASKAVTVGGITPQAFTPDTLPPDGVTAHLPMRILDPLQNGDSGQYQFVAYGTTATVHWSIIDLLLWAQVGQGRGPATYALTLVSYCGAYAEMIRDFRGPTSQSTVDSVTPRIGVFEWPKGSGVWFYGVEVSLSIEEVLSG